MGSQFGTPVIFAKRSVAFSMPRPRLSHYGVAARADAEGPVAARGRRPHMTQHGHRLRVTAVSRTEMPRECSNLTRRFS